MVPRIEKEEMKEDEKDKDKLLEKVASTPVMIA